MSANARHRSEQGFTFIEVIIALMLLAAAASVLIGMEGAAVQRTMHDRNVQQAMLVARRIFAVIESSNDGNEIQQLSGVTATQALQTLGAPSSTDEREKRALDQLQVSLVVQDWQVPAPKIEENPMRRVELTIAWGTEPTEAFVVAYFVPAPEREDPS
jgi:prepilin-type N-terminal cleavage/methylation domain-containing protein